MNFCELKSKKLLVKEGGYTILSLSRAVSQDTEYLVKYAVCDSISIDNVLFSDIYNKNGKISLTPINSPIILNVPGVYQVIQNGPETGFLMIAECTGSLPKGDIR